MLKNFLKYIDKKFFNDFLSKFKNSLEKRIKRKKIKNEKFITEIFYSHKDNRLSSLCDKHGTDKGFINLKERIFYNNYFPHNYADFYTLLFDHCRHEFKNIFELGIGTNNPNIESSMGEKYKPGSSLRALRDYFPNANIFGADIDKNILFNDQNRIKTFYVDQLDRKSVENLWENVGKIKMDLIIDDGIHTLDGCINFFDNSIQYLREEGLFIIEDVDEIFLDELYNHLKQNFHTTVVKLKSTKHKLLDDNNLIIVNKNTR